MNTPFPNRRWLIIPSTIVSTIDFDEVQESFPDSLRYSIDGTKTFVKYDINEVTESYTVSTPDKDNPGNDIITTVEAGIYGRPSFYSPEYPEHTHEEILIILSTEEWTKLIDYLPS